MPMIPTDMRLFGFPVVLDGRADLNVVELRNPRGHRIRIEIQRGSPLALDAVARTAAKGHEPTPRV